MDLIHLSTINKQYYELCTSISQKYIRDLTKIISITYSGNLQPNDKLKKLLVDQPLGFYTSPNKIRIFKSGSFVAVRHIDTIQNLYNDLSEFSKSRIVLKRKLIIATFDLNNIVDIIDFFREAVIAIKQIRECSRHAYLCAKFGKCFIRLFTRRPAIIICGESFIELHAVHQIIQHVYDSYLLAEIICKTTNIDELCLLLRNKHSNLFFKTKSVQFLHNICEQKLTLLFDFIVTDKRIHLTLNEFVISRLIYKFWLCFNIYRDIFPLDIITYVCDWYLSII